MRAKTILIPLDGSEMAEAAIDEARQLAGPETALMLVRAVNAVALPGTDMIDAQVRAVQEAQSYLDELKDRLEQEGARRVDARVWYGPAAATIVEATRLYGADLIVMSTHGRSGLGRVVFGSVAESVLRGTAVPILLVRPTGAPVDAVPGRGSAAPAAPLAVGAGKEATR